MTRTSFMVKRLTRFVLLGVFLFLTGIISAAAQETPSLKEVIEKETVNQGIVDETLDRLSRDPLNRTSPRSTIVSLAKLMKEGKYEDAVEYLDMRYLPETIKPEDGPRLVR